jgi:hypothetical protein
MGLWEGFITELKSGLMTEFFLIDEKGKLQYMGNGLAGSVVFC